MWITSILTSMEALKTPIIKANFKSNDVNCKHFVTRKKRYCRMTVKVGDEYCGEHQPSINHVSGELGQDQTNNGRQRITCPLDPKHTCYANKLKQHLKKCNAKPTIAPPYIFKNINLGEPVNESHVKTRLLSSVPVSQLYDIISKVNKIHKDIVKDEITEKILSHLTLEKELLKPAYGNQTKKHLVQTSSILGLLQEYNLLQPDTCFVEFGAGKGKLSYWVSKTLEYLEFLTSTILLIERASYRHKYDNKLDKTTGCVIRIKADIADLVLPKVEIIKKSKRVVGLSKHLCGDATDLALRCLTNCDGIDVSGVIMAFCCHHRCQWHSYTGRHFFEEVGLSKEDFDIMCGIVSWAVCGTGQSRAHRNNAEATFEQNLKDDKIAITRQEKEEIGKKCKDLINWGRKTYLENHGFKSVLCYYVNPEISLENVCVIGIREN